MVKRWSVNPVNGGPEVVLASAYDALVARLAEAERDAARLQWLSDNPRGAQVRTDDGKTVDCVFWGISAHPKSTLRAAIDAAMSASDSASVTQEKQP